MKYSLSAALILAVSAAPSSDYTYNAETYQPRVDNTCDGYNYEIVELGDTLFKIADANGISHASILAANTHITDPDLIYPGDKVCIAQSCYPNRQVEANNEGKCEEVLTIVETGNTLFTIAEKYEGISLDDLIAANPHIKNPDLIFPGDKICKPPVKGYGNKKGYKDEETVAYVGKKPDVCEGSAHVIVVAGNTLDGIAKTNGVLLASVIAANTHITNPDEIFPGDVVCIPSSCYPSRQIPANKVAECTSELTIVETGDTFTSIAAEFGYNLKELEDLNPHILDSNWIFPGDVICCGDAGGGDGGDGDGDGEDEATTTETDTTETGDADDSDDDNDNTDNAANLESSASSVTASILLGVATLFAYLM
jgi:LysM repeat protein